MSRVVLEAWRFQMSVTSISPVYRVLSNLQDSSLSNAACIFRFHYHVQLHAASLHMINYIVIQPAPLHCQMSWAVERTLHICSDCTSWIMKQRKYVGCTSRVSGPSLWPWIQTLHRSKVMMLQRKVRQRLLFLIGHISSWSYPTVEQSGMQRKS